MAKSHLVREVEAVIITIAGEIQKRGRAGGDKLAAFSALLNSYHRLISNHQPKKRKTDEEKMISGDPEYYRSLYDTQELK